MVPAANSFEMQSLGDKRTPSAPELTSSTVGAGNVESSTDTELWAWVTARRVRSKIDWYSGRRN